MSGSLYKKVGIASVIMMASVFFSRLIGIVREMVIAYIGGVGRGVDAYQVSFVIPEILNHLAASGFLSVTFIPIFSSYLANGKEDDGWKVFSVVMTCFGGGLLALIFAAVIFAPRLVGLLAPGIDDPKVMADAVRMTRIILPAQFFFFTGGMFMAVQFAKEKFSFPALAPLVYNLGIIAGGVALGSRIGMDGFSWGVLAGSFAGNFALQYWGARKAGMRFVPTFDFRHPELWAYIKLTLPLMLGLTMMFSTEVFLKFFGSYLPGGGISALNYGLRIMLFLVGFFGQALGVASFPFLARLAAENRMPDMERLLNDALRYLSLVVPFSVLLIVLRYEIVILLFQRGRFDAAATELTARVLVWLMIGASAFAAQTVVVRGFYAVKNTLLPALYGSLTVVFSLPLYLIGLRWMGVEGVALAVSLSAMLQVTILYLLWSRHTGNRDAGRVCGAYVRQILFAVPLVIALSAIRNTLLAGLPATTPANCLIIASIVGTVFLLLLVGAGYLLKVEEIMGTIGKVRARFTINNRRKAG